MQAPAALARYRRELDGYLRVHVSRLGPAVLNRMVRYHLGWEGEDGTPADHSGKGLRPSLCLLACEAVGGDWRRALPAAAAVELVHNFSLVHDDIQDRDRKRRDRPTVWSIWGEAQAINAGDALLALARLALLRLQETGVSAGMVVQAARLLDDRTLEMVEGQVMDLGFEECLQVGGDAYLLMIGKKTGALFDCALSLGALAGGAAAPAVAALGRCGRELGIAFQVRDDMLGVWGAESRTGKQTAADIRRRKKSLPVIYALSQAQGAALEGLRSVYGKPELDEADVSRVLACLDEVGAQDYCGRVAAEHREAALAELDAMEVKSENIAELRQTAAFVLERDF